MLMDLVEATAKTSIDLVSLAGKKTMEAILGTSKIDALTDSKIHIKPEMLDCPTRPNNWWEEGYSINHDCILRHGPVLNNVGRERYYNTYIIGASQSGKTNFITGRLMDLLYRDESFVIVDPKGDRGQHEKLKKAAKLFDRKIYDFSPMASYKNRINYNPLRTGDLSTITTRIMNALTFTEQYYKGQCEKVLSHIVESRISSGSVIDLHMVYGDLLRLCKDKDLCGDLEVKPNDLNGLRNQLNAIIKSPYGPLLKEVRGKTICFQEAWDRRLKVILDLNCLQLSGIAKSITSLVISELNYTVGLKYANRETPHTFHLILDEFGDVATDNVKNVINKSLGMNLVTTVIAQSDVDISNNGNDALLEQIKTSTQIHYFFNQRTDRSSSIIADDLGTIETVKLTQQTEEGEEGKMGSVREARTYAVHPDIIKDLRVGQCIKKIVLKKDSKEIHLLNTYYLPDDLLDKFLAEKAESEGRKEEVGQKNEKIQETIVEESKEVITNKSEPENEEELKMAENPTDIFGD